MIVVYVGREWGKAVIRGIPHAFGFCEEWGKGFYLRIVLRSGCVVHACRKVRLGLRGFGTWVGCYYMCNCFL
jgi:hypothetical protein